ncbi:MAG: 16S rRNA (guanine(527)-N(7))-methyltransferase RsmG [Thermodesulfobacteriota bacterium]|nr:16S rRNA (guanine(527)-N(7))-methyltransferase RsmG [Thermodesulfobacteriota bacterium]
MKEEGSSKGPSVTVEIPIEGVLDLHTFLPKDIPSLVEAYLTECLQARIYSVRIIHGKGKGVQRNRVHSLLERLAIVASFSEAPGSAGGWGATIVELKKGLERPSPEWEDFPRSLDQGARAMGVSLKPSHIRQFGVHAKELFEWNRVANLTAITEVREVAEKLFLDCLPLVSMVPTEARVLDIGSGGGFPGLPLKVMRPDLDVHLVDASRKKASFLKHVIRTLGLKNMEARHIRTEALAKEVKAMGTPYDVIVSKAAFNLERLVDHALPLLDAKGMIIAMKGMNVEEELKGARKKIKAADLAAQVKGYRLPQLGIERSLVMLAKR